MLCDWESSVVDFTAGEKKMVFLVREPFLEREMAVLQRERGLRWYPCLYSIG